MKAHFREKEDLDTSPEMSELPEMIEEFTKWMVMKRIVTNNKFDIYFAPMVDQRKV